ncbi:hypothetical protein FK178_05675 [Antarcticibacterium arcticum]|uniref:Uncharacterized protein n=1 Tax=Antarcticibacterium arcticum TaxID=2585771 RepID=A0A5B8YH59_9FLAO|nr:hypothetical protein [Antarcticibacterium arcticum]QED37230.1 hypothetical protein FK178_05675 [Antarcticibacterium arcticum]
MELTEIKVLLEKYKEGNTSLEEEKLLQKYFTSGNVPDHLKEYETLFSFTLNARKQTYSKDAVLSKKRKGFAWWGIAASILIAIGIFTAVNNTGPELDQNNLGTIEDPEEAYLKARETLLLVSQALNTGTEEMTYVTEFDKAKNKYLKK